MRIVFGYILTILLIISIAGCSQNGAPATKGGNPDDSDEDFYKEGEMTSCCTPYCKELTEPECVEERGGAYTGLPCSEVDECNTGCCLPFCKDLKKAECTAEFGYGGDWQDKECKDVEECQEVCCTPFYSLNTKPECEMLGGKAEDKTECEKENIKGTLTIEIYYDNACDCGSSEGYSCRAKNGITERLTATLMPDPNPVKDDLFGGNYGNKKYLKGEGTYTFTGSGEETAVSQGEYTCEVPPPAYDFKIPVIITKTTRDDVTGSKTGEVKMTIQEESDGFHFDLAPDFFFKGTKIRTFLDKGERKSCSNSDEDANTEEMDEDLPVEIDGNLPGEWTSDSLSGTEYFEFYPSTSMRTCGELSKGTITFNFEEME